MCTVHVHLRMGGGLMVFMLIRAEMPIGKINQFQESYLNFFFRFSCSYSSFIVLQWVLYLLCYSLFLQLSWVTRFFYRLFKVKSFCIYIFIFKKCSKLKANICHEIRENRIRLIWDRDILIIFGHLKFKMDLVKGLINTLETPRNSSLWGKKCFKK